MGEGKGVKLPPPPWLGLIGIHSMQTLWGKKLQEKEAQKD